VADAVPLSQAEQPLAVLTGAEPAAQVWVSSECFGALVGAFVVRELELCGASVLPPLLLVLVCGAPVLPPSWLVLVCGALVVLPTVELAGASVLLGLPLVLVLVGLVDGDVHATEPDKGAADPVGHDIHDVDALSAM